MRGSRMCSCFYHDNSLPFIFEKGACFERKPISIKVNQEARIKVSELCRYEKRCQLQARHSGSFDSL